MSIFLDTGLFVAFHSRRDENHLRAEGIIAGVLAGEFGTAYTSDYIFDEAVTMALARTGRNELAISLGKAMLGQGGTRLFSIMLKVDDEAFSRSWSAFVDYSERGLSFTDCTSIALIALRKIDKIASFDSSFDGLVERVH
jgi:predicted nucleic acid-binding protein